SVTVTTAATCSASASTSVTINALPIATITTDAAAVCASSAGHTASVADTGVGATYVWNITNGTITAGSGTNAITYTAGTTSPVGISVTVTTVASCSASASTSVTINALPDASITTDAAAVCASSTGHTSSVADAGVGATYVWNITNGTITGGSGTNAIT